jgi:hypothetical protein
LREPSATWDHQPPLTLPPEGARPPQATPILYPADSSASYLRCPPRAVETPSQGALAPSRLRIPVEAISSVSPPHTYWEGTAQSTLPCSPKPARAPLRRSTSGSLPLDIARANLAAELQKYITLNLGVKLSMAISYAYRNKQDNPTLHYTTLIPSANPNLTGMHPTLPTFTPAPHNWSLPDPCTECGEINHKQTTPTRILLPRPHPSAAPASHCHISVLRRIGMTPEPTSHAPRYTLRLSKQSHAQDPQTSIPSTGA